MSVDWTKVNIPLGQGIDTKTDPKGLAPTKLEVLENGVFTNRISIKKRNGYQALNNEIQGGANLTEAKALATRNSELLLFNDLNLYSFSSGPEKWLDKGSMISLGVNEKTVAYTTSEQTAADYASEGGVTVYAWADNQGGVRFSVVDTESGSVIVHSKLISTTASKPRCIGFAGHVHILYVEASSNQIKNLRISATDPVTSADSSAISLVDDIDSSSPNYDVKLYSTYATLIYFDNTGKVKVGFIAINGELGGPGNGGHPTVATFNTSGSNNGVTIAVNASDGSLLLGILDSGESLYIYTLNASLDDIGGVVVPTISLFDGINAINITGEFESVPQSDGYHHCKFFYEVPGTDSWDNYISSFSIFTDTLGTGVSESYDGTTLRHVGIASHAFNDNGSIYVNVVHDSPQQATYFTYCYSDIIIGKHLQGISGGLISDANLPSVYSSDRQHTWSAIFKNRLAVDLGTGDTYSEKGIKRLTLDFNSPQSHRSVQVGDSMYTTGGFLHLYDGGTPVESGFHIYPENITAVPSNTTSGTLTSSTSYNYRCYWEWYTVGGEREISTTASGVQVTMGASDDTVSITVPTLAVTGKKAPYRSEVRLAVTRTEANGTTRYRVDDPAVPIFNDPTVDSINYVDIVSDTVLATRELDYTNAEYDHVSLPAAEIITATKDRIFLAGFEDPNLVMYSKLRTWGRAASFNDSLQVQLDQDGGDITALAPIDDKVIVFKEQRVFAFFGDGPNNTGLQGDTFPPPQLITSDVGCTNQRSIVQMPLGLMFQSSKGIYLLDRNLQLEYIGADVEEFNSQIITSATLMSDRNLVIFLCSSGKTLVYDYFFAQWSTFTNHTGVEAVIWKDSYIYAKDDGEVRQEILGYYKDINSSIKLTMETGWISFGNLQGYAKVRRAFLLGEYKSPHTLRVKVGYNYEPTFANTLNWVPENILNTSIFGLGTCIGDEVTYGTGTAVYGGDDSSVYQVRLQMPRQKCESIKFRFEDVTGNEPGESFELNQLTLEVGVKNTPFKLPSGKTI